MPITLKQESNKIAAFWELTKPRLVPLVLLSTVVGFCLSSRGGIDYLELLMTLSATTLVASGAMALNQWLEVDRDSKMKRTMTRPLPQGRLKPIHALLFGGLISVVGLALFILYVNWESALIAFATSFSYLFIYTPLKPKSPFCTLAGAVPGALPPLIGTVAVEGTVSLTGIALFLIIFFWQMPHFLAISWIYKEDFQAAGFKMLATKDPNGKKVAAEMLIFSLLLFPASLMPYFLGVTGVLYAAVTGVMSGAMIFLSWKCLANIQQNARPLFKASIAYLALLFCFMVINKA